ncbi:MAG: hypothetical protein NVS1B6_04410 [Steroidobacteraceae bacterium]
MGEGGKEGKEVAGVVNSREGPKTAGYELGEERGEKWIKCLRCGSKSFHAMDVGEKYCVKCDVFHEDAVDV